MGTQYSLANHLFMTSPDLSYFYVLDNGDAANPIVVAALPLGTNGYILTLQYLEDKDENAWLTVENSNTIDDPTLERVILGTIGIVQHDYVAGNAIHVMRAWYAGAAVKNNQRLLTVAGIGISDIISADPLKVGLIDAPLAEISNGAGVTRKVIAVQVEASQPQSSGFALTSNCFWTISVLIAPEN